MAFTFPSKKKERYGREFGCVLIFSTWLLPDLRGEFRRSWDNGRGVDAGRGVGTWQNHQLQNHNHIVSFPSWQSPDHTTGSGVAVSDLDSGQNRGLFIIDAINANIGAETRPRNVACLTCIYAGTPA
jgi:phage-related tail fiber protein